MKRLLAYRFELHTNGEKQRLIRRFAFRYRGESANGLFGLNPVHLTGVWDFSFEASAPAQAKPGWHSISRKSFLITMITVDHII